MAENDDAFVPVRPAGDELPSGTPTERRSMGGQDTPDKPDPRPAVAARPGVISPTLAGCLRTRRPTIAVPATGGESPLPDAEDAGQTDLDRGSDSVSPE